MFYHHLTYMYGQLSVFVLPLPTERASVALSGTEKVAETGPRFLLSHGSFLVVLAAWVCPGSAADERIVDQLCGERSHIGLLAFSRLFGKN